MSQGHLAYVLEPVCQLYSPLNVHYFFLLLSSTPQQWTQTKSLTSPFPLHLSWECPGYRHYSTKTPKLIVSASHLYLPVKLKNLLLPLSTKELIPSMHINSPVLALPPQQTCPDMFECKFRLKEITSTLKRSGVGVMYSHLSPSSITFSKTK